MFVFTRNVPKISHMIKNKFRMSQYKFTKNLIYLIKPTGSRRYNCWWISFMMFDPPKPNSFKIHDDESLPNGSIVLEVVPQWMQQLAIRTIFERSYF